MATAALVEVDREMVARMRSDATLRGITGADPGDATAARVYRGYPTALLANPQSASFPRITLMRVAGDIRRPGRGTVRGRVDLWSYDSIAELDAMEVRVVELFDEVHWTVGGVHFYAFSVGSSERTGRAPRSRLHTFEVQVT